jgi:hypothetical protein
MNLGSLIQWERKTGTPIFQRDNLNIRPISRVLTIYWSPYGGTVRNWPIALELEEGGQIVEIPIPNPNLVAYIIIATTFLLAYLLIWLAGKR